MHIADRIKNRLVLGKAGTLGLRRIYSFREYGATHIVTAAITQEKNFSLKNNPEKR